jgi:outer membrane protein OmpA-like peptidoglycan-associated protein
VQEDAAYFTGSTSTGDIDKSFYSTSIFFQPDSTEYDSMSSADQSLSKFAGFYENNTTKGFTYNLYGQAREATQTPEGQKLAADRIEKIKKDLKAQGVPADRITAVRTESQLDNTDATLDRKVFIEILKDKNCQR